LKLNQADVVRVSALVFGFGSLITGQTLEAFGIPSSTATHVLAVVGFITAAAALVSRVFASPSPPPGTSSALVENGMVPVTVPAGPDGTVAAKLDTATGVVTQEPLKPPL